MAKKARKNILFILYILVLTPLLAELLLRITGISPLHIRKQKITIAPEGGFYQPDSLLGYKHRPGTFTLTLNDALTWTATHRENTYRITRPVTDDSLYTGKPELWIFGCSFTHGWSVNDDQTFPWIIQQQLPGYDVKNFGIGGTGTLTSLLQLKDELTHGHKPSAVILAYASFHDERSTLLSSWRKLLYQASTLPEIRPPYARLGNDGKPEVFYRDGMFHASWWVRHSALCNFLQEKWFSYEDYKVKSHDVSCAIIGEMNRLIREQQARFLVAGITTATDTRKTLDFCAAQGIDTISIATDLSQPGATNLPHDGHPSATTQRNYAEALIHRLRQYQQAAP